MEHKIDKNLETLLRWGDYPRIEKILKKLGKQYPNYDYYMGKVEQHRAQTIREYNKRAFFKMYKRKEE